MFPDFTVHYKAIVSKQCGTCTKADAQTNGTENTFNVYVVNYNKDIQGAKDNVLINGVGKTGEVHEKN